MPPPSPDTSPAPPALGDLVPMPYRRSKLSRIAPILSRLRLDAVLRLPGLLQYKLDIWRHDRAERQARSPRILRRDPGRIPARGQRICLYASFAATGRISGMVRQQLTTYARLGFDVVFICTSASVPEQDWQATLDHCTVALHRRNFALDFGSWADAARLLSAEIGAAEEVLLANDSLVGPIRPLDPIFAALRAGGDGLFGLTESLQHRLHLQSYLLLARGNAAVRDVSDFLTAVPLSSDKQRIIQRGELALSGAMAARGHRVAALFGYEKLESAVVADPDEVRRVIACVRNLRGLLTLPPEDRPLHLRRALFDVPLNPTHVYWLPLVRLFGFPFVKTELITKNFDKVPDALDWPKMVLPDSPCSIATIMDHLEIVHPPGVL